MLLQALTDFQIVPIGERWQTVLQIVFIQQDILVVFSETLNKLHQKKKRSNYNVVWSFDAVVFFITFWKNLRTPAETVA